MAKLLPNHLAKMGVHILLLTHTTLIAARNVPQNIRDLYDSIRAKGHCSNELGTGFYSRESGPNTFSYCGDHLSSGIIFLQGQHGALANMDVDCDGWAGPGGADDGRCRRELSPDIQNATAFRDEVAAYGRGIADLDPYVHSYVVFGNARGTRGRRGWRAFDPAAHGMRPLSVMAAVCRGPGHRASSDDDDDDGSEDDYRLVYGVWGDTNGDDAEKPMVGEASLALATVCGGQQVSGENGIDEDDVLYLGFTGDEAVPGPDGADWAAEDPETFERSIEELGNRLVERIRVDATGKASAGCGIFVCMSIVLSGVAVALIAVLF